MSILDKGIATNKTIAQRVEAYQSATDKIKRAYALLDEAKAELNDSFGDRHGFEVIARSSGYHIETGENVLTNIKRSAWRHLIELSGIRKVLSVKRAEALDKKLEDGDLDEITDANVVGMIGLLMDQSQEYATEAVQEVYKFLLPGASAKNRYQTNQKQARWRLGAKVILTGVVQHGYGTGRFNINFYYGREDSFRSLDKVFHLLDGKGIPEGYKSPLIDAINTSPTGEGETEYFAFKGCQNGNLHLKFKRPDLVAKLNQIAGGGYVLPD